MKRRLPTVIALACALVVTSFAACIATPGRAVEIAVVARARAASEGATLGDFTTSTGWRVTLDEARVALAAVRVLPADDALAALERVLVPIAHAHGGHGASDLAARAELIDAMEIDALEPSERELGVGHGTAGWASTLELELGRLSDTMAMVATIAGRAERDGIIVELAGELSIAEGELAVAGLPLEVDVDDGGTLVLEVRVDRWLDQARFERLEESADGAPVVVGAGSQVALAWQLGLRDPRAFAGVWESGGELR